MISQSLAESAADTFIEYLSEIHANRMVCPELATSDRAAEIVSALKGYFTEFGTTTEQNELLEDIGILPKNPCRHEKADIAAQLKAFYGELGEPLAREDDKTGVYLSYSLGARPGRVALWVTESGSIAVIGLNENPKKIIEEFSMNLPSPAHPRLVLDRIARKREQMRQAELIGGLQ